MAKKEDNLIPFTSEQSREKAKTNGTKGGVASGKARREKRDIRRACEIFLESQYKVKDKRDGKEKLMTGAEAITMKQIEKALRGDPKAFELIRDTSGQKPVEQVMVADVEPSVIAEVEAAIMGDEDEQTTGD